MKKKEKKPRQISLNLMLSARLHKFFLIHLLLIVFFNFISILVNTQIYDVVYFSSLYYLALFTLIFTVVETILKNQLFKKHIFLIIKSYGLILLFVNIFAFAIANQVLVTGVEFLDISWFILYVLTFTMIRVILVSNYKKLFRKRI